VANKFDISPDEDMLNNLREIQTKNQLAPSESLSKSNLDFNTEIGTGKTLWVFYNFFREGVSF
jgi:restriction endonuclease